METVRRSGLDPHVSEQDADVLRITCVEKVPAVNGFVWQLTMQAVGAVIIKLILLEINHDVPATGEVGPPLTCPLPDGAGYQVILRGKRVNQLMMSPPVLCSSKTNDCDTGYECIQGLSSVDGQDGACCPDQITTCAHPIFDHDSGTLQRWGFDGTACVSFKWDPEKPSSANNFKTKAQCESYCVNIFS
ncbi:unnamed protein product [Nippostrongylus brasiliensis]|uniref:BPTI/Kunitz inhibitor domain-containing protein n=1 Tax=Nippostrongylus brasiliensis TaxID=27835 RepID=A0A0N4YGF8_NIPBR|nr:unnamed protein product [Nippostrongylus brasiliensis]